MEFLLTLLICSCLTLVLWVNVVVLYILWSATSQSTFVPNLVTIALIVSEKNGNVTFLTFDLDLMTLTLGVGHSTSKFWSVLSQAIFALILVVVVISLQENGKFTFLHKFDLDLCPWPWVQVTVKRFFWSVLSQATICTNFGGCRHKSLWENGKITISHKFDLDLVTLTFGDCSFNMRKVPTFEFCDGRPAGQTDFHRLRHCHFLGDH